MADIITLYTRIASPYLEVFPPNSCIEQTRILIEVLTQFGVVAEPVETTMIVQCRKLNLMYVTGMCEADRAKGKAIVDDFTDLTTPETEGHGHVVAFATVGSARYLIDSTLSQASRPERGFVMDRFILAVPLERHIVLPGEGVEAGLVAADGTEIDVTWTLKGTRNFETTPAWEPSHLWPLIRRIVREMKFAQSVWARRRA